MGTTSKKKRRQTVRPKFSFPLALTASSVSNASARHVLGETQSQQQGVKGAEGKMSSGWAIKEEMNNDVGRMGFDESKSCPRLKERVFHRWISVYISPFLPVNAFSRTAVFPALPLSEAPVRSVECLCLAEDWFVSPRIVYGFVFLTSLLSFTA